MKRLLFVIFLCILTATVSRSASDQLLAAPAQCPNALFVIPSGGVMGWPYKDPAGGVPGYSDVHTGIDIQGTTEDDIYAVYEGTVSYTDDRRIRIWHPSLGVETYYTHLSSIFVRVGDQVNRGDRIGKKGSVGAITVHLHFSVKRQGTDERILANTFDPSPYLAANVNYETGARAFQYPVSGWCSPVGTTRTMRVSISANGLQGNSGSGGGVLSADGRYVAFLSSATNLVTSDTNRQSDVFVRDLETKTTTRVSVASNGAQSNDRSSFPVISADSRYVAFSSLASNLVSGDTNGTWTWDVFTHDQQTGITNRINVSSSETQDNAGATEDPPAISADGRYVAFASLGWSLVPDDTNGAYDVFVRDQWSGTTTRVSVSSGGVQGNSHSRFPTLSGDGRYIAFRSSADNLVAGDTNGVADIFVHDRQTRTTTRISVASDSSQANGQSWFTAISADGQYVSFVSDATNLVTGDTNGVRDVFVHDLQTRTTERVSVSSDGSQGNDHSEWDSTLSTDGRYVAFESYASNLVQSDINGVKDVFVRDRSTKKTTRVSVSSEGYEGNNHSFIDSISPNGRYIGFSSGASNLVPNDTNGFGDVFTHDRQPSGLVTVGERVVESYGGTVRQENISIINPAETSVSVGYNVTTPKRLIFVANWSGSTLRLSVFRPDGSLYDRMESSHPPVSIVVPLAEKGQWSYQITGVDLPYNDYPYVVLVGVPKACALPRDLNVDGKVNVVDAQMATSRWGQIAPLYDLDGDNRITSQDISRTIASWRRTCDNFLLNPGFEFGQNSPSSWTTDAWRGGSTFVWDNTQAYSGNKSVRITSPVANDARWIQTVPVTPNTDYILFGWIKTANVTHAEGSVVAGANLSLYGTWDHTSGLLGTNNWKPVTLGFNSGSSTEVIVACRLGYWSGTATGTMWCDNISLAPTLKYEP